MRRKMEASDPKRLSATTPQPNPGMDMSADMVSESLPHISGIVREGERPLIKPVHLTDAGLGEQDFGNEIVIAPHQHPFDSTEFRTQSGKRLPFPVDVAVE